MNNITLGGDRSQYIYIRARTVWLCGVRLWIANRKKEEKKQNHNTGCGCYTFYLTRRTNYVHIEKEIMAFPNAYHHVVCISSLHSAI